MFQPVTELVSAEIRRLILNAEEVTEEPSSIPKEGHFIQIGLASSCSNGCWL